MLRCRAKMAEIAAKSLISSISTRVDHKFVAQFPTLTRYSSNFASSALANARFAAGSRVQFGINVSFRGFGGESRHLSPSFGVKSFDFGRLRALSSGLSGGGGDKWFLLSWYMTALDKQPVRIKAITSALLTLFGDFLCQVLIDQVSELDWRRTFVFTFLGLVLVGPTLHYWYLFLSRLVTSPGAYGAFLRLLLDQLIFAPAFIGVFLSSTIFLEGRPSQITQMLKQEWFTAVLVNWQLWVPFQFLNFRFVPQKFQVLAANIVSLVWNVILSFKAHKQLDVK